MKRNAVLNMAAPAALSLLLSCVSSYRTLSQTSDTEAGTLKSYCEQNNLQAPEITRADSLYARANILLGERRNDEGYSKTDLAVFYYRLALSKRELDQTRKRQEEMQKRLSEGQSRLATYKQMLKEMKEKEAP
ncbi:MAG: hypothetical protein JW699_08185 [Chitinispirillaceae bacterium]|nr:hypothetical protein [Chitinispirillaceae bacterium]